MYARACCFFVLVFCCHIALGSGVCDGVSPPCFPNYYYVGSGYDSRFASPTDISTGVRQQIVEYSGYQTTPDGQWGYPNGLSPYYYPACASITEANTISGAFAIHKETSQSVSTSIGIGKLYSGSSSTFVSNSVTKALKYNSYSYDSYEVCSQYFLSLNPYTKDPLYNLTSDFISAVETLPSSFDPNGDMSSFETFYKTYGDAFISFAVEGGLIAQRFTLDSYSKANLERQSIDVSQEAQISFEITIGESTSSSNNSTSLQAFSQNATTSSITVIGGQPSYENNFSEWENSLVTEPLPIKIELTPVYVWMNADYFPNDNNIQSKAQAYSNYTQWFLETQNDYGVFIPFYNVAVGSSDKYQASASVSCPSDSVLLSGGCGSTKISGDNWPWRMSGSNPSLDSGDESWQCLNGEDDGVNYKYLHTFAFVMCSPSFYSVNISAEVTQTLSLQTTSVSSSSDTSQKFNNSATASCPSGYFLTGGGCTVSDFSNAHPWITRASYPMSSSTWYCQAAEDYNTDNWYVSVTAYAVCAKWTSTLTYITSLPSDYKIEQCNSGTGGQYHNHCTSTCPSGYYLVGGGCSVGNLNDLEWPWRLTASGPQDNGWYCLAGQDRGRGESYIEVIGYAICVTF